MKGARSAIAAGIVSVEFGEIDDRIAAMNPEPLEKLGAKLRVKVADLYVRSLEEGERKRRLDDLGDHQNADRAGERSKELEATAEGVRQIHNNVFGQRGREEFKEW